MNARRVRLIVMGYLLAITVATPLAMGQAQAEAEAQGAQGAAADGAQREAVFFAVDVFIDPRGKALGAYQFELEPAAHGVKVVGVENGEHEAFAGAPLFDRAAVEAGRADRIIVASYSLLAPERLPTAKTRVARVHLAGWGRGEMDVKLKLVTAGDADGRKIDAVVSTE